MLVANLGTTLAEFARIGAALSLFGVPIAVSAVRRRRRSRIDDVDLAVGQHLGGQVGFTSQRAAMTGHREHCPRASAGATSAAGASAAAEPLTIDLDSTTQLSKVASAFLATTADLDLPPFVRIVMARDAGAVVIEAK